MSHSSAPRTAQGEAVEPPPDLVVMRETAAIALDEGTHPADQAALAGMLRAHLHELVPQVAELIPGRPTIIEQYCALACLGEARRKLSQEAGPTPGGEAAHARRLARVLVALAAHWETLSQPPAARP
ncbi:DUF6415 family natural product biosynthesis protein [Streptomyces sp. NPDC096080]|uniref:DUF6415 family natural product biosynthesis protein n=1 Tax=Streptomyces sp. NPDC096080 TaxID=3156693 RepID=UPI0033261AD1